MEYREWARKTTRAWLNRFVTNAVAGVCDGTWGTMANARFIETCNPQDLIDELVDGIFALLFGDSGKADALRQQLADKDKEIQGLRRLAHDYIEAYEKLAFAEQEQE